MPSNKPERHAADPKAPSLGSALRDCTAPGVICVDHHDRVTACTWEAAQVLGIDSAPLPCPSQTLLPPPLWRLVRETAASGVPVAGREMELSSHGRSKILAGVSVAPAPSGPKDASVVVVLSDLAPVRELERRLWRLDRLASIGTLSASMAHEIKNALVAGKTFIDLLLERHQDAELVEIVRREISRIDTIVTRMLKFVGPARAEFAPVPVHQSLEHSLRLVEPQLERKGIVLTRSFTAATDLVSGDDYELQQAFVNLLLNAWEAIDANGALTVATDLLPPAVDAALPQPTRLRVSIRDTGAGIAPEDMARLFQPFFTTRPGGTGLGLAITQRIVQEHHGNLAVESTPGQGTTFQILLPLLKPEAPQ